MTRKTLSASLINYNHAQYLQQAIECICCQTRAPDELVIVDDGSTDHSVYIMREMARAYSFVRVIEHRENRGIFAAFDTVMKNVQGEYFFGGAADDFTRPTFFESCMRMLEMHPEAGLCSSYMSIFNQESGTTWNGATGWCATPTYFPPSHIVGLHNLYALPGHATIVKRSAFESAGGYIPELRWATDWFLLLVIAFRTGMCYVPEPLSIIRMLSTSYSSTGKASRESRQEVYDAILKRLSSDEYRDVAPMFFQSGVLRGQHPDEPT